KKRRRRVVLVRRYRLHPLAPAGPAAEGREVLAVLVSELVRKRAVTRSMVVRVFTEDLRRIVVHRHGSSLLVLMDGCACGPGSCVFLERMSNDARFRYPAHRSGGTQLRSAVSGSSRRPRDGRVGRPGPPVSKHRADHRAKETECTPSSSPNPANPTC